ncbi:MAG TPA: hypothetical protein VGF45_09675 [Polyangia bacterium]
MSYAVATTALLASQEVEASCAAPPAKIVWSYPADGATDVPTNAGVFVLPSLWQHIPAQITVNGVVVPRSEIPFGYRPTLAPNTKYVVELPATYYAPEPKLSFTFTTGAGVVPFPKIAVPTVDRVTLARQRPLSAACTEVWQATGCFDTGQDTHAIFETVGRPLFWLVQQVPTRVGETPTPTLWPASCGDPELYVQGTWAASSGRACPGRFQLRAVGANGDTEVAEIPCMTAPVSGQPDAAAGESASDPQDQPRAGCAFAGPSRPGLWSLVIVLVLSVAPIRSWLSRRSQSRSSAR